MSRMLKTALFLIFALPAAFADGGDAIYKAKCQMCHAADGSGSTPAGKSMGAHSFKSPEVVKQSDAQLQQAIEKGVNKMPAYQGKLSTPEVQSLVQYIRQLQK